MRVSLCLPGHSSVNYQPQETRSRLSKTVDHVLRDNVAIPHYMHFMELQGADHLARFWLEAEGFRSSSWSRVRAHSLNSVKHSSLAEPVPSSQDGSELRELIQYTPNALGRDSGSDGPAVQSEQRDSSGTEAGLRPGTPRAETPSSQASSRTGTPYKVLSNSTLRDLSDKLMKSESPFSLLFFHTDWATAAKHYHSGCFEFRKHLFSNVLWKESFCWLTIKAKVRYLVLWWSFMERYFVSIYLLFHTHFQFLVF